MMSPVPMLADLYSKWSEKERQEFEKSDREQTQNMITALKECGAWGYASPWEVKFLQSNTANMDSQQHINAIWRKECANILMWALGLRESWPNIDQETVPETIKAIPVQKIGTVYPITQIEAQRRDIEKTRPCRSLALEGTNEPID